MLFLSFLLAVLLASASPMAQCDAPLPAASMVFKSTGQAVSGTSGWCLSKHGYLGSFVEMPNAGTLQIAVTAANGTPSQRTQMVVVAGLRRRAFDVNSGQYRPYSAILKLPKGIHALRIELHSAQDNSDLLVQQLSVQGASFVNVADKATIMRCADDAIKNYRKADISLHITDAYGQPMANSSVRLVTKRLDFKLGTAIPGVGINDGDYLRSDLPDSSKAGQFANFIKQNFNMVEPENAGKWFASEQQKGKPNCDLLDAMLGFAERNGLYYRMHGLLWGWQPEPNVSAMPSWANDLMNKALAGDLKARQQFMEAVNSRMKWWLQPRQHRYYEQDLLNEGIHEPRFLKLYGVEGMAELWAQAVKLAPNTRHAANEYNVTHYNEDRYGNWYWQHIRGMKHVQGIGIQMHANAMSHYDPVMIHQVLQNLSWFNLPITQTEWSLAEYPTPQQAEEGMAMLLKLYFGNPHGDGFQVWGFQKGRLWREGYEMCDENFRLTPLGHAWQSVTRQWRNDITLHTDANGNVKVPDVWYADVSLSCNGKQAVLPVKRGLTRYTVRLR